MPCWSYIDTGLNMERTRGGPPRGLETIGAALALTAVLASCGGGHKVSAPPKHHHPTTTTTSTSTSTTTSTTTTTVPPRPVARCPLTDLPAPGGKVPQRPALAVKVDNLPAARPQFGLGYADVVYEEPVEGGLTRYIAIYQCQGAPRIEPVRSARFSDPDILSQYGAHPLFGFAGAIPPVVAKVDASSLIDVNWNRTPSSYWRDPRRQAPHNLVTTTAALYAAGHAEAPTDTQPPAPVFSFGPLPADHSSVAKFQIGFVGSAPTWTWNGTTRNWYRSYADTGPATMAGGGQVMARNVVVMKVNLLQNEYVDPNGVHENDITVTGSGALQVFRDGSVVDGTWLRPSLGDITKFVDSVGHVIGLTPGQTWIELVPTGIAVTVTP